MRYLCLGLADPAESELLRLGAEAFADSTANAVTLQLFERCEDLLYCLRAGDYDAVIVAMPGALGMEAVRGARSEKPSIPLLWISNDGVFALEGYRQRVNMFLCAPATKEQISEGLSRCLGA
ncbi:MAG: hypothetical protein RR295_02735 [Oscillospiraceae bacterium]